MLRSEKSTSPASLDIKRLGAYVTGAGALSMVPWAEADIMYQAYEPPLTAIDPSSIDLGDVQSIDIDLSTLAANVTAGFPPLGDTDLRLTPKDNWVKTECNNCPKNKSKDAEVSGGVDVAWATNVALGDILGPGTAWLTGSSFLPGGMDRYLGLRRTDGADQFYGWLRYSEGSATLFEAAIENSPDTPIRVGDVPVPVPATLALLVSGAAGLAATRRRRKLDA